MTLQAQQRQSHRAHPLLKVGPNREDPLGQHPVDLVQYLVENRLALVRLAHLVGVRVHQHPVQIGVCPILGHRIQFAADILDRLGHLREQRLQPVEQRIGRSCGHDDSHGRGFVSGAS